MADEQQGLIPADAGSDPASAAAPATQAGSAAPGGSPAPDQGDPIATDPAALVPADGSGQQVDGADQGGPRAKGSQQDAYDAAVDDDPNAPVPATPEEQRQYESLVTRFILYVSDPRQSNPKHASPNQAFMATLNTPKVPAAIAIAGATAKAVMTLLHTAKIQGKPYDAEPVFYAGDEIIPAAYLLGAARGIWKDMPPYHGVQPDGSYDFADDEIKVIGEAKMQTIRLLGNMMVKAGMITADVAQANAEQWKQQIEREISSGSVSDEVMQQLAQKGVFDKIHDQLGTAGLVGAPGQAPTPAAPDPSSAPTADPGADASATPSPADAGSPGLVPTDASETG